MKVYRTVFLSVLSLTFFGRIWQARADDKEDLQKILGEVVVFRKAVGKGLGPETVENRAQRNRRRLVEATVQDLGRRSSQRGSARAGQAKALQKAARG